MSELTFPTTQTYTDVSSNTVPNNQSPLPVSLDLELIAAGPSYSDGNFGGWGGSRGIVNDLTNYKRGIKQGYSSTLKNFGEGDTAGLYQYVYSVGGPTAPSDEGVAGITVETFEFASHYVGAVATTTGTGDTQPTFVDVPTTQNWVTDGGIVLDITNGTIAGKMTGPGLPVNTDGSVGTGGTPTSFLFAWPVTLTAGGSPGNLLPATTAWAHAVPTGATIDQPTLWVLPVTGRTADVSVTEVLTVQLYPIAGQYSPFAVGPIRIAGSNRTEQSFITHIEPPSTDNTQQITFTHRYGSIDAYIFQGGVGNQYVSFDANHAYSGLRTSHRAIGSLDGQHLIYLNNALGQPVTTIPSVGGYEPATADGGPSSGFHLYPGAENTATGAQKRTDLPIGLQVTLEPNTVAWAPGDAVEAPLPAWFGGNAVTLSKFQASPVLPGYQSPLLSLNIGGPGVGPESSGIYLLNSSDAAQYKDQGGSITKPTALTFGGYWTTGQYYYSAPEILVQMVNQRQIKGTTISGSSALTLTSTSNLSSGALITGPNIPDGTTISDIVGNVATMSQAATASATNQPINVPLVLFSGAYGGRFQYLPNGWFEMAALQVDVVQVKQLTVLQTCLVPSRNQHDNSSNAASTQYVDAAVAAVGSGGLTTTQQVVTPTGNKTFTFTNGLLTGIS